MYYVLVNIPVYYYTYYIIPVKPYLYLRNKNKTIVAINNDIFLCMAVISKIVKIQYFVNLSNNLSLCFNYI